MTRPPPTFAEALVEVARSQLGVRETRGMPNRGPEVDQYLRSVGLDPTKGAYPWCAAFVYHCAREAAKRAGLKVVPMKRTASVHGIISWANANAFWVEAHTAREFPSMIQPGWLWVRDHGKGKGHVGIVAELMPSTVMTIEGNTDDGGSREGDGVYLRDRPIAAATGFVRL